MKVGSWAWWLACAAVGCTGWPHAKEREPGSLRSELSWWSGVGADQGRVLELDLTAGAPESTGSGGLFPLPAKRTYLGLVRTLDHALTDERVTGLYVGFGTTELGWARAEELGALLREVRRRHKAVVCHAHSLGNPSIWMAAQGCDRIWVSPAGGTDANGLGAQVLYFGPALDKVKARADLLAIGKYKSAAEGYTRAGPTDEARESLTETLASIRATWLDGMRSARTHPKLLEALEHGPWSPSEAKARGLVDAIGYESEARTDAELRGKASRTIPGFGPRAVGEKFDFGELVRVLAGADERTGGRPRIAVVAAEGAIGLGVSDPFGGGGILAEPLTKALRKLKQDDSVKAVVLRIDSPGGSALASDLLWHELMELRQKKPLVASVGGMAASGGYYLASAAQRIVAEKTSIVGSIGVVGGKLVLDQSLAAIGINVVVFPASGEPGAAARAGAESPLVPWDDAVRERVRSGMQAVYDLFVERVAQGRGRPASEIRPVAEGRIWSGAQGKERGLVDELGGLGRALQVARELGALDESAPVTLEGPAASLLETLLDDDSDAKERLSSVARRRRLPALLEAVPERLRTFATSLGPLVAGKEPAVAALPFGLIIE
jgi:protease-4